MFDLRKTTKTVKMILMNDERARNSDDYLYYVVCRTVGAQNGFNADRLSFREATLNRKKYGLPSREAVRRARQKAQRYLPETCANGEVEGYRQMREEEYRGYAREHT